MNITEYKKPPLIQRRFCNSSRNLISRGKRIHLNGCQL
ncbi:hypothetical protein [Morganella morganii IS15]|nr:hypothetical protein CSB69_0293 [Morganella morganii]CDK65171.1 hypothetical protein [Morganella morganii IS15]